MSRIGAQLSNNVIPYVENTFRRKTQKISYSLSLESYQLEDTVRFGWNVKDVL